MSICLLFSVSNVWASELATTALKSITVPSITEGSTQLLLASNSEDINNFSQSKNNKQSIFSTKNYKTPLFSANKLHKYLGIGAVIMGGVTALSAPDGDNEGAPTTTPVDDDFHQAMALTATTMAVLATATGFLFHYEDLGLSNGLTDPDNMHMALGLLGTLGYLSAVGAAPENGGDGGNHSTYGILGGASMLLAIKLEW